MSTKQTKTNANVTQSNVNPQENTVMSTINNSSDTSNIVHPTNSASVTPAVDPAPVPAPAPAPSPAPPPQALPSPVGPPPPVAVIPTPPPGFLPVKGGVARGVRPRKTEVIVLPEAVDELRAFADWQVTLGKAAPNQADMVAAFESASEWTVMKTATRTWLTYSSNEEGVAWIAARAFMATVKPLLTAAVTADPAIASSYPKLCALFGAKSSIAKKAVSTKAANKKADAQGKPATHGEVGKQRQKAAAKAALAEKEAAQAAAQTSTAHAPATSTTTAVNGSSNGVTHA
jgi:hypothetical protein